MPGLVAVTGATGFIGQALISALVRKKWLVRALTRRQQNDSQYVSWIVGDLDDIAALGRLVNGVSAVIHCAGRVRGASSAEFMHTNAQGTANIVSVSAGQHPQPQFLLISSLAAREPQLSWYADSKFQAEQELVNLSGAMRWDVFRPTAVYGPGDRELSPLLTLTKYGLLPMTVSPHVHFGLIYVDDLVSAIICWLESGQSAKGVYELDDGTPGGYDSRSVRMITSAVWNRPVYVLRLPPLLIRYLAQINLLLARTFNYSPMLTPGKFRELQHNDWVCDITPLTSALGWKPTTSLMQGMPLTVLKTE